MGEHKRHKHINEVTKQLVDKGLLIEVGWVAYKIACYEDALPKEQEEQLRDAFFAGAEHLFSSILSFLTEDEEPTEIDMRRMSQVDAELETFLIEFKKRHGLFSETEH